MFLSVCTLVVVHTRYRWKLRWYQRGGGVGGVDSCRSVCTLVVAHTPYRWKLRCIRDLGGVSVCLHPCCSARTLQVKTEVVWRGGGGGSVCVCALVAHTHVTGENWGGIREVWGGGGRFLSVCVCTLVVAHTPYRWKLRCIRELGGVSVCTLVVVHTRYRWKLRWYEGGVGWGVGGDLSVFVPL